MTDKRQTRQQVAYFLKKKQDKVDTTDPFCSKPLVPRSPSNSSSDTGRDKSLPGTLTPDHPRNPISSSQDTKEEPKPKMTESRRNLPGASRGRMEDEDQNPTFPISLKDALSVVPKFNGKNIPLSKFLEGCNKAREILGPYDVPNLVRLIRSKIKGETRAAILGLSFPTIESLKDFFKDIYASTKTEQQLLGELGNEYQRDSENVIAFANHMRDLGAQINEAHKIIATDVAEVSNFVLSTNINCKQNKS